MIFLLDTHVLLWAAGSPERISPATRELIENTDNELLFSAASLWEIVIKRGLGRDDFRVEPSHLRRGLLDNGYRELAVSGDHALGVQLLPPLHRDPFDRLLLAQAHIEGATLLTADQLVAQYPGPVRTV